MPGSVIRRLGHTISDDGLIRYQEEPAAWHEADALAGRRVDRRRCYAIIAGDDGEPELCEIVRWTAPCSGCSDDICEGRGAGCHECGYQGVVRNGAWVPASMTDAARAD